MDIPDEDILEFKEEAIELFTIAEEALLEIENGGGFKENYDSIFRAFHSVKGAASMLALDALRDHMHHLENIFQGFKDSANFTPGHATFFLQGIDAARIVLNGNSVEFDFSVITGEETKIAVQPSHEINEEPIEKQNNNLEENINILSPQETSSQTQQLPELIDKTPVQISSTSNSNNIVIIDDDTIVLETTAAILTANGSNCQTFSDPKEALKFIAANAVDLVITDLVMPDFEVHQLMTFVKKHHPKVPIIILSGMIDQETAKNFISSGIYAAIQKPFTESTLLVNVTSAIKHYQTLLLLSRAFNVLLYQINDLEDYMLKNNKAKTLEALKKEISEIMNARRKYDLE